MPRRALAPVLALAALVAAVPSASAAKPLTITGRIQGKGTAGARVIALAKDGTSVSATVKGNRFTLAIPATVKRRGLTINVVGRTGRYLGPIVLARTTRAGATARDTRQAAGGTGYAALSNGASGAIDLGAVAFAGGAGTPQLPVPADAVDTAAAVKLDAQGLPAGAGENGLTKMPTSGNDGAFGADPDRDGIVNAFDQDQNGNLLLNQQDQRTVNAVQRIADRPFIFSSLFVPYADAIRGTDFAANVRNLLAITFGYSTPNAGAYASVSVDCLGIAWCDVATVKTDDYTDAAGTPFGRGAPWPLLAGTDRHAIGFRRSDTSPTRTFDIAVQPNSLPSQVAVGQSFAFHAVRGDTDDVSMLALGPYFSAPPVPTKIGTTAISTGTTLGAAITAPLPIAGTKVDITVLRPLRPPVPGAETGDAISMGRLNYGIDVMPTGITAPPSFCPAAAFSNLSETLAPSRNPMAAGMTPLADSADDAAPSDQRTVSFTVDLAQCGNPSITVGTTVAIDIVAADAANNNANVNIVYLALQ